MQGRKAINIRTIANKMNKNIRPNYSRLYNFFVGVEGLLTKEQISEFRRAMNESVNSLDAELAEKEKDAPEKI